MATRKKTGKKVGGKAGATSGAKKAKPGGRSGAAIASKAKSKAPAKSPRRKAAATSASRKTAGTKGTAATGKRRSRRASAAAGLPQPRRADVRRETSETRISVAVAIEEPGYSVTTGVPFLDHMLEALSRHSNLGLVVRADGDTHVDDHHTVEDVGLAIGEALREALGDKAGIYRFGHFEAPLDEALVAVTVDLSGRPYLVYNMGLKPQRVGTFDVGLVEDFFQALMTSAGMNLHINVRYGRNPHHIIEATFKAFAKALRMACSFDGSSDGVPSTKGSL